MTGFMFGKEGNDRGEEEIHSAQATGFETRLRRNQEMRTEPVVQVVIFGITTYTCLVVTPPTHSSHQHAFHFSRTHFSSYFNFNTVCKNTLRNDKIILFY